jgi:hypothetical protein
MSTSLKYPAEKQGLDPGSLVHLFMKVMYGILDTITDLNFGECAFIFQKNGMALFWRLGRRLATQQLHK